MSIQPGQTILNGKYRIDRLIANGGMARVWLAEELTFGQRPVALKEPRDNLLPEAAREMKERYQREVQVCAALDKARVPNIVRAITADPYEDTVLLAMEYMPGGDLAALLKKHPEGLPVEQAVRITLDLLAALEGVHAHELEIVHRDVKPSNVLFDEQGKAHLADFGLAQLAGTSGRSQLAGGQHPGTPRYMAPEQESSPRSLTPAADLYAVGCILFEMLTGTRYKRVRPGTLPSALKAETPGWLDEIVAKALAEDPWERYQHAAEMARPLRGGLRREVEERARARAVEEARQRQAEERARLQAAEEARRRDAEERARAKAAEQARQREAEQQARAEAAEEKRRRKAAERARKEEARRARRAARARVPSWLWAVVGVVLLVAAVGMGLALALPAKETPTPVPTGATAAAMVTDTSTPAFTVTPTSTFTPTSTCTPTFTVTSTPTLTPTPTFTPTPTRTSTRTPTPTLTPTPSPTGTPTPTPRAIPTPKAPQIGSTQTRAKDGMVMVYVPSGEFVMGSDSGGSDEQPVHTVYLDAYWIDRTEVTNAQYLKCVEAGVCRAPADDSSATRDSYYGNSAFDNHPVIHVDWNQASAYCQWAGGRLPTEAQWEKAARGPDGRAYPWGNQEPDCSRVNYSRCVGDTSQVGSYSSGASPYGAQDMAGNVWEWVSDWYENDYYSRSPEENPKGPESGAWRVLRGGSWVGTQNDARSADRLGFLGGFQSNYIIGFRCVVSPRPSP